MTKLLAIDAERLSQHRAETFALRPDLKLTNPAAAIAFVNARGYVHFWPIKGALLPNLWSAVAGERPVADKHDDPGHITWGWKDQALDKRWWYYGKVIRGKATMISLQTVPYFYALSENYGDPEHDYLEQYQDGLLSHEARRLYETLLTEGPLDTVTLRRQIHMTSKASNSPFDRALTHLQRDFKILPVGVAQTGAWRYSFIYECVHRWYPDLPERARAITRAEARRHLAERYFEALGAATLADARKILQWPRKELAAAIEALIAEGRIVKAGKLAHTEGEWLVLARLVA